MLTEVLNTSIIEITKNYIQNVSAQPVINVHYKDDLSRRMKVNESIIAIIFNIVIEHGTN